MLAVRLPYKEGSAWKCTDEITEDEVTDTDSNTYLLVKEIDSVPAYMKCFIMEQIKVSKLKNRKGMRWHPKILAFALQLHMRDKLNYEQLVK